MGQMCITSTYKEREEMFNSNLNRKFFKDGKRDWEICYRPIFKKYSVIDKPTSKCVALNESIVEDGVTSDEKFNELIEYVDGLLCTDSGISSIHIPALVSQPPSIPSMIETTRLNIPTKVKMKSMHRRSFGVPIDNYYPSTTTIKRTVYPVRKKIECREVESREQWAKRLSKEPYLNIMCFTYTGGVRIIVNLPFDYLLEIRHHFINEMEMNGFKGAIIDRKDNWWPKYYLEIYFNTQRRAEMAISWICKNYIEGRVKRDGQ